MHLVFVLCQQYTNALELFTITERHCFHSIQCGNTMIQSFSAQVIKLLNFSSKSLFKLPEHRNLRCILSSSSHTSIFMQLFREKKAEQIFVKL